MPKYRVLVHGTNFSTRRFLLIQRRLAFYTTCFVEAETTDEASRAATDLVRDDPRVLLGSRTPVVLAAEEVTEIRSFDGCRLPRTGLAFYPANRL